ncbi:MAG: hypothetical protein IIC96_14750 [Chloroflexi bacterium]|nr:hypothetical protein [Chloroflexota bacterium]
MITRSANVTLLAEEYDEAIQWHCEQLGLERGKPWGAQAFFEDLHETSHLLLEPSAGARAWYARARAYLRYHS